MGGRRRPRRATAAAIAVAASCLLTPSPGASSADRPVPFRVGEVLTYDVAWSNVVSAGTVVMSVRERRSLGAGRAGYYCLAEARPSWLIEKLYPFYYKVDAMLDTATLRPAWAAIYSDEKGHIENHVTRFVGTKAIEYERLTSKDGTRKIAVPQATLDGLSAIYALRTYAFKAGQTVSLSIADRGQILRARVVVTGMESITTTIGTLPAWRLTPTLTDEKGQPTTARDLSLWISTDARRLPLRLQAGLPVGSITLSLTSAR